MNRLSKSEINAHFNTATAELVKDEPTLQASPALIGLSHAIADLRAAELDVAAEVFYLPNRLAFSLLDTENAIVPFSGILHVAGQQLLFGIVTAYRGSPCLKISVSQHDVRFQGGANKVDSFTFDLTDPERGIKNLQKHLIDCVARSNFVAACDPAQVFEQNGVSSGIKRAIKRKAPGSSFGGTGPA